MFCIFFAFLLNLNSFEDKFTARGIFVTVEYKANEIKGSVKYSFKFLTLTDLLEIYKLPFYLIDDIKNFRPESSFKFKVYGQSFYLFKYLVSNKNTDSEAEKGGSNSALNNKPDFFESYERIFKDDFKFFVIDIAFRSVVNEYSNLPLSHRKAFISDLNVFFKDKE